MRMLEFLVGSASQYNVVRVRSRRVDDHHVNMQLDGMTAKADDRYARLQGK
jgi:hypothetical protein